MTLVIPSSLSVTWMAKATRYVGITTEVAKVSLTPPASSGVLGKYVLMAQADFVNVDFLVQQT